MPRREIPATYGTPKPGISLVPSRGPQPGSPPSGKGPIVAEAVGLGGYFASARLVRLTAWGATIPEALAALQRAKAMFPKGLVRETSPDELRARTPRGSFAPNNRGSARERHRKVGEGIAFGSRV